MSNRYTVKDVREAFAALADEAAKNGMDSSQWQLQEASLANGRPYRLFGPPPGQSNLSFTSGNGFLGDGPKEACRRLEAYQAGMFAVRFHAIWVEENA